MVVILDLCERSFFKIKQPVTGDTDVHTDTLMSSHGPHPKWMLMGFNDHGHM